MSAGPARDDLAESSAPFDLAVVGGGIFGAATARDAALRGLRVALFEKGDVASATSSSSSKLVHGGLRYLETFQFRLVRESLAEQALLLATAPHLVWRCPFLVPQYAGRGRPGWYVALGLALYDRLAGREPAFRSRRLSRGEALRIEPGLPAGGLTGASLYYDSQVDDARLCLETLLDAREAGAAVWTHHEVFALERIGASWRLTVRDRGDLASDGTREAGAAVRRTIEARVVVNAAGPWVDRVRRLALGKCPPVLTWSRGAHLVVPALTRGHALLLTAQADRRVFFVLPHEGSSLVGTTEGPHSGELDSLLPTRQEMQYLGREIRSRWDGAIASPRDIRRTFAGVRALAHTQGALGRAPRDERIVGEGGLLSVAGGKYTTHRAIAERLVDRVERLLGRSPSRSATRHRALPGGGWGDRASAAGKAREMWQRARAAQPDLAMTVEDAERLGARYGSRFPEVLAFGAGHVERFAEGGLAVLEMEVIHAVRAEAARRLDDVILRRLGLWSDRAQARRALPPVSRWMARAAGWSEARRQAEVARVESMFQAEEAVLESAGLAMEPS